MGTVYTSEACAARAESGGPEFTGVDKKFNLENVASFDETLRNEIESGEDASPTLPPSPFGGALCGLTRRIEVVLVEPDNVVHESGHAIQTPVPSWGLSSDNTAHNPP